jgi:predicted ATPase/DNA-binding CsgD family transcriptional regulator
VDTGGTSDPVGSLPAEVTTFIGRGHQLDRVSGLLRTERLVTFTGPPGVGKTRLALHLAARIGPSFRDGAYFADLTALNNTAVAGNADLVSRVVARSVGIRSSAPRPPIEVLQEHLKQAHALLVLDNCEHVVEQVAVLVGALLRSSPDLTIVATSRRRLGVQGEHTVLVPPLSVPSLKNPGAMTADSVQLLTDRARASVGNFELTDVNRDDVLRLCQRLGGIPLAIELAAIRLNALSVREILEQLPDPWRLLSGGGPDRTPTYHRTLRDAVTWSWDLCSEQDQRLWARLSVFSGGFDLAAAENVCSGRGLDRDEVRDVLSGLVEQSIVVAQDDGDGRTRYRMLEFLRAYGEERLRESGEQATLASRHVDFYLERLSRSTERLYGTDEVALLTSLRNDLSNLRAALGYCLTHEPERGLELAIASVRMRLWEFSGAIDEGRSWLERLSVLEGQPLPARALASSLAAWYAIIQGDRASAEPLLVKTKELARHIDPAPMLFIEGVYAFLVRGSDQAYSLLLRAHEHFTTSGAPEAYLTRLFLALWASFFGTRQQAMEMTSLCLQETEAAGAGSAISWSMFAAAVAHLRHGNAREAETMIRASLAAQQEIGDIYWGGVWGVALAGWIAAAQGHYEHAAELLGASEAEQHLAGAQVAGLEGFRQANEFALQQTREGLGAQRFAQAYQRGAELPDYRSAIDLALSGPASSAGLTDREREVAELVAQGMSNREIGETLFISPRTAERHIHNAAKKLQQAGMTLPGGSASPPGNPHHRARMLLAAWVAASTSDDAKSPGNSPPSPDPNREPDQR